MELQDTTNLDAVADALKDLDADVETVVNEQALSALDAVDAIEEIDTTNVPAAADAATLEMDEEFLKDLDISVAKATAYGAQEVTPMPDIAETVSGATAAAGKTKKAKTTTKVAGAAPTPRPTKELTAVPAEFFDLDTAKTPGADPVALEANKTAVIAKRPAQVKIAEKFDNLFTQLAAGRAPSTYVMQAFKLLDEKKTVSSADLIANYRAAGLGDGTARSQTGQIMVLFDVTGISARSGKNITLNATSKIADRIRALTAAPVAAA